MYSNSVITGTEQRCLLECGVRVLTQYRNSLESGRLLTKINSRGAFTKEGTFILTKAVNLIITVTIKSERKRNSARNLLHGPRARIVRGVLVNPFLMRIKCLNN